MKRINKLYTYFVIFSLPVIVFASYITEDYEVKKGDTLSEVLYERVYSSLVKLYGTTTKEGLVSRNKKLNPEIKDWKKLQVGSVIKLEYPEDDVRENFRTIKPLGTALDKQLKSYHIEHRFGLGLALAYITEEQNIQILKTDPGFMAPVIQYNFLYRESPDFNKPSWEFSFFGEMSHLLKSSGGLELPVVSGAKFELGFARSSLFKFGTNSFTPYLGLR